VSKDPGAYVRKATFAVALCVLGVACVDKQAQLAEQSLAFLSGWFAEANAGTRDAILCHGLGTLKHPEVSCTEMLAHAAKVEPTSRVVDTVRALDCFSDICGEFIEVRFNSHDIAGNETRESAVLKRDDGILRLYWYRSDSLLETMRATTEESAEEEKDPLQIAYDELVARYPKLYAYPPCYAIRASSSNSVGTRMAIDAVDEAAVTSYAATCGETFCFALVGNKIAPLCPN
jgi:hypothetical protein